MTDQKPKPRGFAAISLERRREIASMGGKAHQFTTEEARAAGSKRHARPTTGDSGVLDGTNRDTSGAIGQP